MSHEFDGQRYAEASSHQREWGERLIGELGLEGAERVLDLGCGDGALTARLAALVPDGEVVGIDASLGMIEAACAHRAPNLRFLHMDIAALDLPGTFDVVFSNAALHWVTDHSRLYGVLEGLLAEGGRVRFDFAGDGNCASFLRVVRGVMARPSFAPLFADFEWPWYMPTLEEYARIVASAGFSEHRVWDVNADRYFPDAASMIAWVDQPSIVPFLEHLPSALRPAFRDQVIEGMLDATLQADGRCFETFRRVEVWGIR